MKKALIIFYSQAGQTAKAVEEFRKGLQSGYTCDVAEVRSAETFSFPWKMTAFFRAFPRCHRGPLPEVNVTPPKPWENYDLVVLAYQVWFLSPSLPIQGFLHSQSAQNLSGKEVLGLVTCRNLFTGAMIRVKRRLTELGAEYLGQITLCERTPLWASFVTTPRWMLTGRKNAFSIFPEAGLTSAEYAPLAELGRRVADPVQARSAILTSNLNRVSLELMDLVGSSFFRFWSKIIFFAAPKAGAVQDLLLLFFRLNLMLLIISAGPCTKIFESIVSNDFKWIARLRRFRGS